AFDTAQRLGRLGAERIDAFAGQHPDEADGGRTLVPGQRVRNRVDAADDVVAGTNRRVDGVLVQRPFQSSAVDIRVAEPRIDDPFAVTLDDVDSTVTPHPLGRKWWQRGSVVTRELERSGREV